MFCEQDFCVFCSQKRKSAFGWGYADNASSRDLIGGVNCLRIANAVTADGEPANLTQVDLAEKSGVGLRFVRELEQGKQTLRIDKINQVLALFGHEVGAVPHTS